MHGRTSLEQELQSDPNRPTIVLEHHPVTAEAAWTHPGGPTFILNSADARRLQRLLNSAPGVFLVGSGHTHRAKRTKGDFGAGVDYLETGVCKAYPGGYTLVHIYTGGYQVNFHRVSSEDALSWTARCRWAIWGFEPEALLGRVSDRNYVVRRRIIAV